MVLVAMLLSDNCADTCYILDEVKGSSVAISETDSERDNPSGNIEDNRPFAIKKSSDVGSLGNRQLIALFTPAKAGATFTPLRAKDLFARQIVTTGCTWRASLKTIATNWTSLIDRIAGILVLDCTALFGSSRTFARTILGNGMGSPKLRITGGASLVWHEDSLSMLVTDSHLYYSTKMVAYKATVSAV
jgi:hypothetical protein